MLELVKHLFSQQKEVQSYYEMFPFVDIKIYLAFLCKELFPQLDRNSS
jgi:hypothetical protein